MPEGIIRTGLDEDLHFASAVQVLLCLPQQQVRMKRFRHSWKSRSFWRVRQEGRRNAPRLPMLNFAGQKSKAPLRGTELVSHALSPGNKHSDDCRSHIQWTLVENAVSAFDIPNTMKVYEAKRPFTGKRLCMKLTSLGDGFYGNAYWMAQAGRCYARNQGGSWK